MKHTKATKLCSLLLALSLTMAACGDADDDASDAAESSTDRTELANDSEAMDSAGDGGAGTDDEGLSVEAADRAMEEEPAAPADAAGGFFADAAETTIDTDPAREQDNTFRDYGVRPFVDTDRDPISTFALDVDTASYSVTRQWLREGLLPPFESVRVEEFVNSFDYDYLAPNDGLIVVADAGPSPFDADNIVVRLGVQAEQVSDRDRPAASLTFVVDTSGSMDRDNRIDLVKVALSRLVNQLDEDDEISIVTFGNRGSVLLEPTSVADSDVILDAIDSFRPNGSTDLESGLRLGYELADDSFRRGGINRVILLSDGVANAGLTDPDGLVDLIRDDADRGIQLVSVGVGMGNFNDVLMETLADDGDGFYAYVNETAEAERLFTDDLVSSLLTVAIDGKIQVEFDESTVERYRLIGFENRAVLDDDFRNDAVDAGELGAGHQVTALYEITLRDGVSSNDRLGTAALRWEDPDSGQVIETRLELTGAIIEGRWADTSDDFRLAVTVGAFAEILRQSQFAESITLAQVFDEADALSGRSSDVRELAELIAEADRLR